MSSKVTFQRRCSIALLIPFLMLAQGCVRQKDFLDAEVRRLCALDGGMLVLQKLALPRTQFDQYGEVRVVSKNLAKPSDAFLYESETAWLRQGYSSVWRSEYKLIRRLDEKILGKSITYSRRGGDFPGPLSDSSFGCPVKGDIKYLSQAVFETDERE